MGNRIVTTVSHRSAPVRRDSTGKAAIPGCTDSRAPAEIIPDTGIGDTFNTRIAGNVVNDDAPGNLEFAWVPGHTACGAMKGVIDEVEMGNLTGLLARMKPAITATVYADEKSSKNAAYFDAVARTNVLRGTDVIRQRSKILADPERRRGRSRWLALCTT
jgi:carbonic anhydrase